MSFPAAMDLARLDEDPSNIALVRRDGTIAWINRAWRRFAEDNGGLLSRCDVGTNYFDAVRDDAHGLFVREVHRAGAEQDAVELDYECSSERVQRRFRLRIVPLDDGGYLMVHHLRIESAHPGEPVAVTPQHVGPGRLVVMCSGCRRTARNDYAAWDWIPSWVTTPPARVSHGLCPVCLELFFFRRAPHPDR